MSRKQSGHQPFTIRDSDQRIRCYYKQGSWWSDRREGQRRERRKLNVSVRSEAAAIAKAMCRELAFRSLSGAKPDSLTLAPLFAAYERHKGRELNGQWKRGAETRVRLFTRIWGETQLVGAISQTHVDHYCRVRRAEYRKTTERPLRDGAIDCDFRWLSSVFNWAVRHKLSSTQRLLGHNPLHDCAWPKERNVRRPIASHSRFLATIEHAARVDPRGRLRLALAFARYTGRRIDAILHVRASDVLLTEKRIKAALAAAGMDERQAEHMPQGAIRWVAESDKMGLLHVAPISAAMRDELERYLSVNPRVGDVPLKPSDKNPSAPVERFTATKWLLKAEQLAEQPKLAGGLWHPYRRLWATERQNLSDVAVAAGGGWKSTKTLKVYQQVDPASVFAAVAHGA